MKKSADLLDWTEFPFTSPNTTLNTEGEIEFNFESADPAAFFRIESR